MSIRTALRWGNKLLAAGVYLVFVGLLLLAAPRLAGFHPVVVLSGSMEPACPVGSLIYYRSTDVENIEIGDLITFSGGEGADTLVTHRVVGKDKKRQEFRTKGDANETEDSMPVEGDRVVGKALDFAIPKLGYLILAVRDPRCMAFMAGIVFLDLGGSFLSRRSEEKAQE